MRTLKYAILGLLNRKPMTGYDIGKEFNYPLAEFWDAKHSQIYPELKKLSEEGLIQYDIKITGDSLQKKLYTITSKGQNEFLSWLSLDDPMEKTPKSIFRLRMFFSNNLDIEQRLKLLQSQLIQHTERLNFLHTQMNRYTEIPSLDSDDFGDYIVLDSAILREEGIIKWLNNYINICNNAK